ncbi:thioredoxin family protein [Oceanobacillus halotolerans]|uniref:thioredoxin family protein n=1 Tax=Oceanobacillus halotolerans TaxID=2663380 RepID=UPI0013DA8F25|nr:thioredoxin family protein [Oceanobacillus halotolerans]
MKIREHKATYRRYKLILIGLFVFLAGCGEEIVPVKNHATKSIDDLRIDLEASHNSPYFTDMKERELERLQALWEEEIAKRHKAINEQGNIFNVKTTEDIEVLANNTKYMAIIFYDNYCFAQTQDSYNMIYGQEDLVERIPDMIFVDIHINEFPGLAEYFGVTDVPYTILFNKAEIVHSTQGYYTTDELEEMMYTYMDIE